MAKQVHVFPQNDARQHLVSFTETCWCQPQVNVEVSGDSTVIHRPIKPMIEGHDLNLAKALLTP